MICLQAGHEGRVAGATGSPGEIELTVRIRNRLSQLLIAKGFQIQLVNADPTNAEISQDYQLFLALHGDANIYGTGGGCIASGDPKVDLSYKESARIRDAIASEYFEHSEIVNHPERVNRNMTEYYMWSELSSKTPCVIIEMGVTQDAHDKVLLNDTERIAEALARGICKAFGVSYEAQPQPQPATDPHLVEIESLKTQLKTAQTELSTKQKEFETNLAVATDKCNQTILAYKNRIKDSLTKLLGEL